MKVDPVITRKALEEKDAIFQEIESKKGSLPHSFNALYEYINMVKKVSDNYEAIKGHEAQLAEARQNLEKVTTTYNEVLSKIEEIEGKFKIVKKYHSAMEKIKNLVSNCLQISEDRAKVQAQYIQAVGGNVQAINNMNNLSKAQTQSLNQSQTGTVGAKDAGNKDAGIKDAGSKDAGSKDAGHVHVGGSEEKAKIHSESPFKSTEKGQTTGPTNVEEEEFGGEGQEAHGHGKKEVRSQRPETDIGEEPLAAKKEGGCEGCNIF